MGVVTHSVTMGLELRRPMTNVMQILFICPKYEASFEQDEGRFLVWSFYVSFLLSLCVCVSSGTQNVLLILGSIKKC